MRYVNKFIISNGRAKVKAKKLSEIENDSSDMQTRSVTPSLRPSSFRSARNEEEEIRLEGLLHCNSVENQVGIKITDDFVQVSREILKKCS